MSLDAVKETKRIEPLVSERTIRVLECPVCSHKEDNYHQGFEYAMKDMLIHCNVPITGFPLPKGLVYRERNGRMAGHPWNTYMTYSQYLTFKHEHAAQAISPPVTDASWFIHSLELKRKSKDGQIRLLTKEEFAEVLSAINPEFRRFMTAYEIANPIRTTPELEVFLAS